MHRRVPLPTLTIWGRLAAGPDGTEILTDFKMVSAGVAFSPPLPPSPLRWGVGHRPMPAYTFQTEACRELKASQKQKNKAAKDNRQKKRKMRD